MLFDFPKVIWREIAAQLCDHCQHNERTGKKDFLAECIGTPDLINRQTLINLALVSKNARDGATPVLLHHVPFSVAEMAPLWPGQHQLTRRNLCGNENRIPLLYETLGSQHKDDMWRANPRHIQVLQIDPSGWKSLEDRIQSRRHPPDNPVGYTDDQHDPYGPDGPEPWWVGPQLEKDQVATRAMTAILRAAWDLQALELAQFDYPSFCALYSASKFIRRSPMVLNRKYWSLRVLRVRWEKESNYPLATTQPPDTILSVASLNILTEICPQLTHLDLFNCPTVTIDPRHEDDPDHWRWLPDPISPDLKTLTRLEIHNPTFGFTGRQLVDLFRFCTKLDTLVYWTDNALDTHQVATLSNGGVGWWNLLEPIAAADPAFIGTATGGRPTVDSKTQAFHRPPVAPFLAWYLLTGLSTPLDFPLDERPLPRLRRILIEFPHDCSGTVRGLEYMTTLEEIYLGGNAAFYNADVPAWQQYNTRPIIGLPPGAEPLAKALPKSLKHLCLFNIDADGPSVPQMDTLRRFGRHLREKPGAFPNLKKLTICPVLKTLDDGQVAFSVIHGPGDSWVDDGTLLMWFVGTRIEVDVCPAESEVFLRGILEKRGWKDWVNGV